VMVTMIGGCLATNRSCCIDPVEKMVDARPIGRSQSEVGWLLRGGCVLCFARLGRRSYAVTSGEFGGWWWTRGVDW